MAIEFEQVVLRGEEQQALTIEEGIVILRSGLDTWDLKLFDKIDATIGENEITTLKEAFEKFEVRPNVFAYDFYKNHLVDVKEVNDNYFDADAVVEEVKDLKSEFAALLSSADNGRTRLAAVEAKATALEGRVDALEA